MRAEAQLAEEVGYDGVMVSEHHAGFPGYLPNPLQAQRVLLATGKYGFLLARCYSQLNHVPCLQKK